MSEVSEHLNCTERRLAEKATDAESLPVSVVPEMSTWRGSDTEGGGKTRQRERKETDVMATSMATVATMVKKMKRWLFSTGTGFVT